MAIVNGTKITQAEFYDRLQTLQMPQGGDAGHAALMNAISRQLLEEAFKKNNIDATPQEVDAKLNELIQNEAGSQEAFQKALAARGQTLDEAKKDIAFGIKLEKLCTKDVKYTEDDVKAFFAKYQTRYNKPLRVTLSVIVTATAEDAKKVRDELNKPDANFATLARTYSVDPASRERGGRMPEMAVEQLPPAMRGPAQKLQVGGISDPIGAQGQFAIVKVEERKAAEKAVYDNVKQDVDRDYKASKAVQPNDLVKQLAEASRINIISARYQDLNELFGPKQKLPQFGAEKGGKAGKAAPEAPAGQGKAPAAAPAQTPADQSQAPAAPAEPAAPTK